VVYPPRGGFDSFGAIASEVKDVFVRRFRSVKGEGWRLRHLHEVGLENFVREVLAKGECKKVVQMPTGAGKSVLMALLALATAHLRGRVREGDRRNVMLVFAPLNRIKLQLIEPLVIASGACEGFQPPSFSVYCISSAAKALDSLYEELLRKYRLKMPGRWFGGKTLLALTPPTRRLYDVSSVGEALRMVADRAEELGEHHSHIAIICPHAFGKPKGAGEVFKRLRERALAVFIDEAHVMVDVGGKWGMLMAQLARAAPVAVGFTATPVVETCEVVAGRPCARGMLLHGEPIHSHDLMLRRKWIPPGEEPILVSLLVTRFYRSSFQVLKAPAELKGDDVWRGSCRNRVEEYAERVLQELERHFGLSRSELLSSVKVLVLAPNTKEADMWGEVLRGKLRGIGRVFVAHSRAPDPQGEIEKFVKSRAGILVAVNMVKLGFDDPDLDALVIARPTKSGVVYVQMRGRVLRYPKSPDRLKLKRGAFLLHLAADGVMEDEDKVKSVERGAFPKAQVKVELEGFGEGAMEFSAIVKTDFLGESVVGALTPQPPELPPPAEAAPIQPAGTAAPTPEAAAAPSLAEQPSAVPPKTSGEGIFRRIFKALLSALRRLVPAKR
jgi:hypothetical protein